MEGIVLGNTYTFLLHVVRLAALFQNYGIHSRKRRLLIISSKISHIRAIIVDQ